MNLSFCRLLASKANWIDTLKDSIVLCTRDFSWCCCHLSSCVPDSDDENSGVLMVARLTSTGCCLAFTDNRMLIACQMSKTRFKNWKRESNNLAGPESRRFGFPRHASVLPKPEHKYISLYSKVVNNLDKNNGKHSHSCHCICSLKPFWVPGAR
jgi:hypothetical protein